MFHISLVNDIIVNPTDHGLHQIRRQNTPALPKSVDFDITSRYKKSVDGERYLLADRIKPSDGDAEHRLIVFATDQQLRLLFTTPHVMMDGTFDTCPAYCDQIYSIHAKTDDQSILITS